MFLAHLIFGEEYYPELKYIVREPADLTMMTIMIFLMLLGYFAMFHISIYYVFGFWDFDEAFRPKLPEGDPYISYLE